MVSIRAKWLILLVTLSILAMAYNVTVMCLIR